jgi:hypothetical protein
MGVSVADVLFVDTQIRRGWHREDFTAEELILVPEGMDAGRARAAVSASRRAGSKRFSTGAKAVEACRDADAPLCEQRHSRMQKADRGRFCRAKEIDVCNL